MKLGMTGPVLNTALSRPDEAPATRERQDLQAEAAGVEERCAANVVVLIVF
jgi:hypothetical protein